MLSAFLKIAHFEPAVQLTLERGVPLARAFCASTAAVEFLGASMLVLGLWTRGASLALAAALVPSTLLFNLGNPQQHITLFKDLAVLGGLAQIFVHGAGPIGFDAAKR